MFMPKRSSVPLFTMLLAGAALALQVPSAIAAARHPAKPADQPISYSAYNAHPRLVVILVIDQFRGDYLDRYRADFKGRGFRLFLDRGAYFPDCYYDYANTKTAPGHATIGTGAYTDGHGIASNEWWDLDRNKDRPVSSVEDERYRQVGGPETSASTGAKAAIGASPRNLLASTVGDELRLATQGQSRVFGISFKDRASILPAGSAANGAFWIDQASGAWVSSTYYMPQLPAWASAFNSGARAGQASKDAVAGASESATLRKGFYSIVGSTPAANSYELDFAQALIAGEQLGSHATTDLLTISLSANDIMGHQMGPDSNAERQMVDGLDTDFDSFFTWLDKNVEGGMANVWVALSADHGIAPIPAEAAKLGVPAASIDLAKLTAALNDAINLKFSPGEKVDYLLSHQELPYIALNRPAFERTGVNETEAEEAVQRALPAAVDSLSAEPPAPGSAAGSDAKPVSSEVRLPPRPTLVRSYTRLQLAGGGDLPHSELGRLLAHSYSANGGWYVMTIFADYQMESFSGGTQTTHFSPWSYDRHVPLGFYGAPFVPGIYHGRVAPVDLAATLASLLGINQPSASIGSVLTQALRPVAAVTYPRPPAAKAAHGARRTRTTGAVSTPPTGDARPLPDGTQPAPSGRPPAQPPVPPAPRPAAIGQPPQ
ncbi:MAG TPA: alkaline phosphatase family protein [Acidisarcina sp.]